MDGSEIEWVSSNMKRCQYAKSFSVIGTFALLVLAVVGGIYVLRAFLQTTSAFAYASLIASILNSGSISGFNMIYSLLAKALTDMENNQTDTQYEESHVLKLFMFQFVNNFTSFFYIGMYLYIYCFFKR